MEQVQSEVEHVSITKSFTTRGLSRPGITLTIANSSDTPVAVWISDSLPSRYALASIETTGVGEPGWASLVDGSIEGTVPVGPDNTVTLTYLLADRENPDVPVQPAAVTLPTPEIIDTVPIDSDRALTGPALSWYSPGEERLPLFACNPTDHPAVVDAALIEGWLIESFRSTIYETTETVDRPLNSPETLPVIGIVAHEAHADAVFGTILRARERGLPVFVTYERTPDSEVVRISDQLGATIVDPPATADEAILERTLSRAARDAGFPGIVFQLPECPRIDYRRTLAAFESDGFETAAIPDSWAASTENPHVIIGIPGYNAEGSIGEVVEAANPFADLVLVVDDGSEDATAARAREAGASVVVHERNRGYGGALKTIFQEANQQGAKHLVTLDADGQHDPTDVPKLVEAQESEKADVVIGSRYVPGSTTHLPMGRAIGLGIVNLLTNLSMGRLTPRTWVHDTQSGFRAYSAQALASLASAADIGDGMWASTDIMYHASSEGFDFAEVGTTITYDVEHGSTQGAFSHGTGLVRNIAGFLEQTHPILLLGLPGGIGVLIGVVFGSIGLQHLLTNEFSLWPILIGSFFIVIGFGLITASAMFYVMNTYPFHRQM